VSHPEFSLHRSMSAIELMDPKMDTGMCRDVVPSITERIRDGTLPLRMEPHHAARVMDTLLCHEMAHRTGCSMPTSIVTCLYGHDEVLSALRKESSSVLEKIHANTTEGEQEQEKQEKQEKQEEQEKQEKQEEAKIDTSSFSDEDLVTACVWAYAVATLKCCRVFTNVVKVGDVYEDEDFCDYERYPSPRQEGGRLRLVLGDHVDTITIDRSLHVLCEALAARSRDGGRWSELEVRMNLRKSWWSVMKGIRPLSHPTRKGDEETMENIRILVAKQLKETERCVLETSRLASMLKRTMNDVWSNLNPKVAEVEERREVEEEEKTRRKEEAAGNVNELERSMALVGTYDERQAISDEGGLKYGVDTRASREVRENYFFNQKLFISRCLFLVIFFCISFYADHNILCFFLFFFLSLLLLLLYTTSLYQRDLPEKKQSSMFQRLQ